MHTPQHQFDPVAASAIAAINSTQRAQQSVTQTLGAPQPPGINTAFGQTRSLLQQASSLSPLNILGTGQAPQLPGMQGQLPGPQQFLPGGASGQAGLPTPQQVLPDQLARAAPPVPPVGQNNGGAGGTNGGNGGSQPSQSPQRRAEDRRT